MKDNKSTSQQNSGTVDPNEVERFTRMAEEWWDPQGKFKPLHQINPLRSQWIVQQAGGSLEGKTLLDIGCGGGLISEAMARAGASVTGIDAGEKNITIAQLHAQKTTLSIDYRCTTAEALAASGAQYDVVLALEIIEHVADIDLFVRSACKLLTPGGLMVFSTLNRTAKSYAMAIIGAEYVLRWLPIGTHHWKQFVKPSELHAALRSNGIEDMRLTGLVLDPLKWKWRLDAGDLDVNYLIAGRKV